MYNVFLSHNRIQKPWVRELYRFLEDRGLTVFFDEESIPPGQNIVKAIEEALAISQYVVLILSQSSLKSEWVAMEIQLSVHSDPAAIRGKLIPVIVETVDFEKVRPSVQVLNCIDLSQRSTREDRLRFLLKHIGVQNVEGINSKELGALISLGQNADVNSITVGGLQDVLDWGWDVKLTNALIDLDYATVEGLIPEHEGDFLQWAPIFANHPDTWRMLFTEPECVAGYWHFVPLFPDDYALAKKGGLRESDITADRVQPLEFPGWYDIYFAQICMLPKYRNRRNIRMLFDTVFEVIDGLAKDGIFIREVCANAYTDVGRALCKSFRLQYLCEHQEHGWMYAGSMVDVLSAPAAIRYGQRLLERYQEIPQPRHSMDR